MLNYVTLKLQRQSLEDAPAANDSAATEVYEKEAQEKPAASTLTNSKPSIKISTSDTSSGVHQRKVLTPLQTSILDNDKSSDCLSRISDENSKLTSAFKCSSSNELSSSEERACDPIVVASSGSLLSSSDDELSELCIQKPSVLLAVAATLLTAQSPSHGANDSSARLAGRRLATDNCFGAFEATPCKRLRLTDSHRPYLDFDKMRKPDQKISARRLASLRPAKVVKVKTVDQRDSLPSASMFEFRSLCVPPSLVPPAEESLLSAY